MAAGESKDRVSLNSIRRSGRFHPRTDQVQVAIVEANLTAYMTVVSVAPCQKNIPETSLKSRSSMPLDLPGLAISLSGLDCLAGLLDLLQDRLVFERVGSDDFSGLSLEGDVV